MKKTWSMTVGSYMVASLEQTATLMARDYKDPPLLVECWVKEKMKDGTYNGNRPGECRNNAGGVPNIDR